MKLLPGEHSIGVGLVITSRIWAAKLINKIGEHTEYGAYPHSVSAFDFGRAVGRALTNCNEDDPITEFTRGLDHYFSARNRKPHAKD